MNLRLKWVLSFFLWATAHAIADDYWNVENGELLRQIDFEGLLKLEQANQEFFVYIYMKDCGICEKVKPMLLEALAKYKEETDDEFVIYAIDNVRYGERIDKETAYWKQTEGVPFFGMFKGGKKLFEIDPRSTDSFLKFFHNPVAPYVPPPEPEWSSLPSSKDISFLEENGFDAFVGSKSEVFLMVFKTRCGACTAVKPNFEEVATKLSSEKPEITLAALEMTKGNAIINRYNVQAYPTFLYFSGGKFQYEYHGGYKADKLESFCRNPSFIEKPKADLGFTVETNVTILDASADKFLADNEGVLVMVHTSWCGHCKRMKPDYIRASDELFAQGSKQRLAAIEGDKFRDWLEPYGVTGFPTLLYFEKGQFKMKYSGGRTKTAILKFMKNPQEQKEKVLTDEILESLPDTIPALKKDTFDAFVEENPRVVVYFYAPWCGVCKGSKTAFYEAYEMADEEDLDVKFAVYNADPKDDPAEMLFAKEFGIKSYPTVWFFEEGEQKYKFNAQSDMDSFLRFAREPHLRGRVNTVDSDPKWISADGNMYIEILTDETYEEFVAENEEVFIFWVAEGCIRCYEIVQPEFVILAETLATLKPSFKLAVIDGSEYKDFRMQKKIDSYPTLEYFKRGVFQYLYENHQTGPDMLNFARNPTKAGAEKPKRYVWELDESRDSGNVVHVNKDTFPVEVQKVKYGLLMLHAGGFEIMDQAYDTMTAVSKELAANSDLKFFACDCGRGKDWGKLCHTEGIHRWPDFRFYVDGESDDEFDGGNFQPADFISFINSKLPSSKDEL